MKKIILLTILLLLCSCEAKYQITLEDNNIHEEIKITEKSSLVKNATDEEVNAFADKLLDGERGFEYYNRELFTEKNLTGYLYTYDFKYDEYESLAQITKCYSSFKITNNNNIIINTSDEFICMDLYEDFDNVEIIIESKYKVVKSNADKQDGNKQIWIINKDNYSNKPINIELDKTTTYNKKANIKKYIILVIFIILIIAYILLSKKEKKKH